MPRGKSNAENSSNGGTVNNGSGKKQYDNSVRKWFHPGERAKMYAKERKAKVYIGNKNKKDQPISEYDLGLRSGYLLARSDEAGMFKYKQAIEYGMTKKEAAKISKQKGKYFNS